MENDKSMHQTAYMDNFSIIPTVKIYAVGIVWWLWFMYQPIELDMGLILVLFTAIFYFTFIVALIKSKTKIITLILTSPVFASISIIVAGAIWYIVAEFLGIS